MTDPGRKTASTYFRDALGNVKEGVKVALSDTKHELGQLRDEIAHKVGEIHQEGVDLHKRLVNNYGEDCYKLAIKQGHPEDVARGIKLFAIHNGFPFKAVQKQPANDSEGPGATQA